jgi:cytoskeletal protein CcmA (bactofilin family)
MIGSKNNGKIKQSDNTGPVNLIALGTVIKGDMFSPGDIRIDGTIQGNVESKSKVVVGNSGVIKGRITSMNADISGMVSGEIHVGETLSLKATSNIEGDISTDKLIVESGASFNGSCSMGVKNQNDSKQGARPNEIRRKEKANR